MTFFTYMLACADKTLYTGWTTDITHRLKTHNEGKGSRYTRARLPVMLLCYWEFGTKSDAMRWEVLLKRLNRRQKLACLDGAIASDPEAIRFVVVPVSANATPFVPEDPR